MPGLASADPHTHSTLSISRTNGQQRSNGIVSPRSMDQSHDFERLRAELQNSLLGKEPGPYIDAKEAEESLSLYCKPIELYNIIQKRNLKNPIFLQRCLRYKMDGARQRGLKLTISAERVSTIPFDVKLNIEELNGRCTSHDSLPSDQVLQQVLVMLAMPISTSGMGYSCFRVGQTRVLRTTCENISGSQNKGPLSITFILPELQKLQPNAEKDGTTFIFISSVNLNLDSTGKGTQIGASVNANGSVLWGSVSLTALCKNWSDTSKDGRDNGLAFGKSGVTVQVDLYPSSLQLLQSTEEQYVNFQSIPVPSSRKCMGQLQVHVSGEECSTEIDEIGPPARSGRVLFCPSLNGQRLQPGQVIFHYYYYFNRLYKSEVTENYTCSFCVRRCVNLKGLRCHLNSSHDLFRFEFFVTGDYRIVSVFCRNDVLGPEGNVRDVDGLNDPRLKHFVYWSKCGRRRRSASLVDNIARRSVISSQNRSSAIHDYQLKDPSTSLHLVPVRIQTFSTDVTMSKEYRPSSQKLEESPGRQVLSSNPPKTIPCASTFQSEKFREVQLNIERPKKKRGRPHLNTLKISEQTLQALKRQRSEICNVSDAHALSAFGPNLVGNGPNGVCLAIAAPMLTDKSKLQHIIKPPIVHSGSLVKHQKTFAERSEARIRAQLTKREFFHSHTSQPMSLEQLLSDRDSEDERDDEIMDLEDRRMLDDFVDVTPHEKELMHLWNSYVRKQRILADSHCPWGCEAFAKLYAKKFNNNPSLRRCFMLFLIKLWNHNLVDGNVISRCLHTVDSFVETMEMETKA